MLNSEGFLFYYRQFVHTFLEEINYQDLNEETSNFNINVFLTMHELKKLEQFAASTNNSEASAVIQDTTEILNNMFRHVEYFKPEEFAESISKAVISIALDPRVQIALFLIIVVITMVSLLANQIQRHGFSVKSLIASLLMLVFIISVVNNHFLIIQKNQIFKNQKLNEKIPDECFGSSISSDNENSKKESSIFSQTISHFKGYFKLKPTSQVCLEFQEALLLDSKHANFIESIIFTITEAVRPFSVLLGESINLFFSSLTKNLSFYQYMPLMAVVTLVMVPLVFYVISLLSLVLFGYEFNFFHLISFKKSKTNNEDLTQQTELLKILAVLKKENEIIASNMLQSRMDAEPKKNVRSITSGVKAMTISNTSEGDTNIQNLNAVEDSAYVDKKPDSYYNDPEPLENEKPDETTNTSVNESICEEVVKYVNNSTKKASKLMEKNEILQYENKKLKDMIFYQRANQSITECDPSENKENMIMVSNINQAYSTPSQISIGLSKTVKRHNNSLRSLKNSYIKDISDTDFGDDDEDILVILDEK